MWEHCLSAGWSGLWLLLHQAQHLGLSAKTLMLETFSEMKKQLTEISLPVPPILLQLLPPILSVKRGEVRHRPPLHTLLPLDGVEKKVQQALPHYLRTAVQPAEETPQSETTEFKPNTGSLPCSEVLVVATSNLFHKQFYCLSGDEHV